MTVKDPTLTTTGSHFTQHEHHHGRKEEVYGYFSATWRGQPVTVTMSADKYEHSSGMSDWRVYAQDARYFDPERNGGRGDYVTDTARSRLSDACKPLMVAWLETDEYQASRSNALARMILRQLADDATGYSGTHRTADLLATYWDELPDNVRDAIDSAVIATDAARKARSEVGELLD